MRCISEWLDNLGLGQYSKAFVQNDIDFSVLPDLTDQDLEKIGVSLGHRRRLLRAIVAVNSADPPTPAVGSPTEHGSTAASLPTSKSSERRQLTVMFVDLAGSTALAGRIDPEDMREVITGYQDAVTGVVPRFEGHVAKYMGDGVLCYFGWPKAHEDDAELAVRAALSVLKAVSGVKTPAGESISARVGIATGLVVVGDLIGKGAVQEEAVIGETPNIAARLQALAAPGQIVIAESTRRLFGDIFELTDLGRHQLKGFPCQISAFGVMSERAVESRFEARASGAVSGMVGREHELALILQRWKLAKAGEGQLVLLSGEAGIGKSRVCRAVLDAIAKEAYTRISCQCSPYHPNSPLFPVIQHLTFSADLLPGDSNDEKLDKLESVLVGAESDTPLIAALIGLDHTSRYGVLTMTPQQQRARTLQALVAQLMPSQEPSQCSSSWRTPIGSMRRRSSSSICA